MSGDFILGAAVLLGMPAALHFGLLKDARLHPRRFGSPSLTAWFRRYAIALMLFNGLTVAAFYVLYHRFDGIFWIAPMLLFFPGFTAQMAYLMMARRDYVLDAGKAARRR